LFLSEFLFKEDIVSLNMFLFTYFLPRPSTFNYSS
jgi:hypothetical protein